MLPQRLAALWPAVTMGIVAFALVLVVTDPPGPGLDPDALQYMGAAASLAARGEYTVPLDTWSSADSTQPLTHFPPGYPTALSLPVRMGMEPPQAARLIAATAGFVTITTIVLLVSLAVSPVVGVLLGLSLFAMTSMYTVHASVLSEPLYLASMFLTLAAMVLAPDRPLRAGIPAAAALMTRYAGLSIVGAIALWQLGRPGRWSDRLRRAAMAVAPALVLQVIWVMRTRAVATVSDIRTIAIYGQLGKSLAMGGNTLVAWLVPDPAAEADQFAHRALIALAAASALAGLTAIGFWHMRRMQRGTPTEARLAPRLAQAASLLFVCYAGLLGASRILADPGIPFDQRILAPALLLVMMLAAVGLSFWWRGTRLVVARVALATLLVTWWCAGVATNRRDAHFAMTWGSDFAGQQWRDSEVLAWARREGTRHPLYSNWPVAVYFYLQRPSRELPYPKDVRSLKAFGDSVRAHDAYVLLFNVESPDNVPTALVRKASGLEIIEELNDGWVLGAGH